MRTLLTALLVIGLLALGCDASFKDLSPSDGGGGGLSGSGGASGTGGAAGTGAGGGGGAGGSGGAAGSGGTSGSDGAPSLLSMGEWTGRNGYGAMGTVSLVDTGSTRRVELGADFVVQGVPGPFVVVSARSSLSGGVQEAVGDRTLGPLDSNSGAQSYDIPDDVGPINFVWVYCLPFTVEVARAELVEVR